MVKTIESVEFRLLMFVSEKRTDRVPGGIKDEARQELLAILQPLRRRKMGRAHVVSPGRVSQGV